MDNCFRAAYRISASSLATVMSSATLTAARHFRYQLLLPIKKRSPQAPFSGS